MLIKDEPYVAYLLTRYEKKQRDLDKFGVDVPNGDRLVYRHHTSPEFNIGKFRIRMKITTTDWQLKHRPPHEMVAKAPGLAQTRNRLPRLVHWPAGPRQSRFNGGIRKGPADLKCPESVTGYREVRYPKMDQARTAAEAELRVSVEKTPVLAA